jgi:hypoxanthine-guanine phosphoribosyltransferase
MTVALTDGDYDAQELNFPPAGLGIIETADGEEIREDVTKQNFEILRKNTIELFRRVGEMTIMTSLNGAVPVVADVVQSIVDDPSISDEDKAKLHLVYVDGKREKMAVNSNEIKGQPVVVDDIVDSSETIEGIKEMLGRLGVDKKLITLVPVVKTNTLQGLPSVGQLGENTIAEAFDKGEELKEVYYVREIKDWWVISSHGMHGDHAKESQSLDDQAQKAKWDTLERLCYICLRKLNPDWVPADDEAYSFFLSSNSMVSDVMSSAVYATLFQLEMEDMNGRDQQKKFDIAAKFFDAIISGEIRADFFN